MKLLLLAGLGFSTLFSGHGSWLHPQKFIYKLGELVNIRVMTGQNYEGRNWNGNRDRIKFLQLYYANVTDDCIDQLSKTGKGDSLQVSFFEEGTMMFAFASKNSFVQSDSAGEYYACSAKTLVQVGQKLTNTFKRQTSLTIDIIPQENPYSLHDGEKLKVKLYFNKKPMVNTLVELWHRNNEHTVKRAIYTDEKGEIEFPVFIYGRWMITATQTVQLPKDPKAEWQQYEGSLTWGYLR